MKKPLKFYGDIDVLMELKFFRADREWLNKQIPNGCERILNLLSEEDLSEIFVNKGT